MFTWSEKKIFIVSLKTLTKSWVGLGCRNKANCGRVGFGIAGWMLSMSVFLRDSGPYLCKLRKLWKTLNGYVDKLGRGMNLEPPVYQFWAHNPSDTGRDLLRLKHYDKTVKKSSRLPSTSFHVAKKICYVLFWSSAVQKYAW